MILTVGSLYKEVGVNLEISHKVSLYIRKLLIEQVLKMIKLDEGEKKDFLHLTKSTNRSQLRVEVELSIDENSFNYLIKLPYEKITKNKDQREAFLKYYFDGLVIVFKDFGIDEKSVREIEETVKQEVLYASEYKYTRKKRKVDLSKLGL